MKLFNLLIDIKYVFKANGNKNSKITKMLSQWKRTMSNDSLHS